MKTFIRLLIAFVFSVWAPAIGSSLNQKALDMNDGHMPVWCITAEACVIDPDDTIHVRLTSQSRDLFFLDIIPVVRGNPLALEGMESVGDLFYFGGFALQPFTELALLGYLLFAGLERFLNWLLKPFRPGW